MSTRIRISCAALALTGLIVLLAHAKDKPADQSFRSDFTANKADLVATGTNPYFIPLTPGYRLTFKNKGETLVITVLDETKTVDGVACRIVEEKETVDGKLKEVSRNYFAIDKNTKDVYYFGEDVDIYKNGKVANHEGAWLSGVDGAKFGLMMPGQPKVGDKFYQEQAPKVAMDRCEIISLDEKLETPAGKFEKCLRAKDTSAIESGSSLKIFAPGIGLIKDDEMELVRIEKP